MASSKDDNLFRKEFAKSLAEALLEKEQQQQQPTSENVVHDAYVALCHDDPQVESDEACRLLATALTGSKSQYRLSERIAEGIQQATGRTSVVAGPKSDDDDADNEDPVWLPGGAATAAGYASLAVACFVKIPLQCCQSSDINVVKDYLGSFRGPRRRNEGEGSETKDAEATAAVDRQVEGLMERISSVGEHNSDEASSEYGMAGAKDFEVEEVWAAESDPSDFEYESEYDQRHALQELERWTEAFDPIILSKPPPSTDWENLSQAVANLLSGLSYSRLSALSAKQWNSLRVSDLLSQLTLTLLIRPENASTALLNDDLQQLGVQPLFVLRDRMTTQRSALGEYLTLVQTLIAVDAADTNRVSKEDVLAPATIVGLGALSQMCQATHPAPQQLRQCILETVEDLAHIMERSRNDAVHLTFSLLPLLDRLTNVRPDGSLWESSSLKNADAQLLLQAGMFRELILLLPHNDSEARTQLVRSLQVMCIQSTSLLGKYAWRVPQLAMIVQTREFAQTQVVDGMVWNLLGSTLSDGPVRLKLKTDASPTVTAEQCRTRALANFERLLKETVSSMDKIGVLRTGAAAELDDWTGSIRELSRFTNYLVSCPSLATLWRHIVLFDETSLKRVKGAVESLHNTLSSLPSIPETSGNIQKSTEKSAENDKAGTPLERPTYYGENEQAAIRKALKILSVSLQSIQEGYETISSKTD